MEDRIKTRAICENTLSINVKIYNNKGAVAFFNNIAGSVSKYLIDNDMPLLYLELSKKSRVDVLSFVFKEKDFVDNKSLCMELVENFMKEVVELNVKKEVTPAQIEEEFNSFKEFKNKISEKESSVSLSHKKPHM